MLFREANILNFPFSTFGRVKLGSKWRISYQSILDCKLYYILGGKGSIRTSGGETVLCRGKFYLIPSLLEAEYISDPENPIDHLFFNFIANPPLRLGEIIEIEPTPEMKLLGDFAAEALCGKDKHSKSIQQIAQNSFDILWIYISDMIKLDSRTDERIIAALDFMHKNYSKPIAVSDMAAAVHLENCHFIKLFSKQMGITPYKYLKNYRMDTAIKMIKNGCKIGVAAYLCGFETPSAFSAAVKKQFGITPREL